MPRSRPETLVEVKAARRGEWCIVVVNGRAHLIKSADVDWSKGKPNCKRCHTTGISGYRQVEVNCKKFDVGNVCSCIIKRGGLPEPKIQVKHG